MNGLEIIVTGILILCGVMGYRAGFLRVVYSLVVWILVLGFVTWFSPYITEYLETNTKIKSSVQEKCRNYLEEQAEKKLQEETEKQQQEYKDSMQQAEIWLPETMMDHVADSAAESVSDLLLETGLYEQIAETAAHYILQGIGFFLALFLAGILVGIIGHMLDLVSRLPLIHGTNKVMGAGAGLVKGLIIIWLLLYILAICAADEMGREILTYVEESPGLSYLYNHNILLEIILNII